MRVKVGTEEAVTDNVAMLVLMMMMAVWVVITMLLSVEVMMRMVENLVMDVEFVVE